MTTESNTAATPPLASHLLSGENARLFTESWCPLNADIVLENAFQIQMVVPELHAFKVPSGDRAIVWMANCWALS